MKNFLVFLLAALAQAGLHVIAGWQIALVVPFIVPFVAAYIASPPATHSDSKRAWILASAASMLAWVLLLGANFVLAGDATRRVVPALAGLVGGSALPAFVLPLASVIFAGVVGMLAGLMGSGLRRAMVNTRESE
jgi:hypothetical protein